MTNHIKKYLLICVIAVALAASYYTGGKLAVCPAETAYIVTPAGIVEIPKGFFSDGGGQRTLSEAKELYLRFLQERRNARRNAI